jgi:hypothetical protein
MQSVTACSRVGIAKSGHAIAVPVLSFPFFFFFFVLKKQEFIISQF